MDHTSGESIAEIVFRHERDLYRGNGLPGICTRVKTTEDDVEALDKRCDASDKKLGNTQNMFWAVILLLLTILGTQMASLFKPDIKPSTIRSYNE